MIGKGDGEMLAHAGNTAGFSASTAYSSKSRMGVVALANCATGGDQVAMHILSPSWPFSHRGSAPKPRKEVSFSRSVLGNFVGKYEADSNVIIVTSLHNGHLMFMAPGSPMVRLHAESEANFFIKKPDLGVSFKLDGQGKATEMGIHLPGLALTVPAKRLR